MNVNAIPPFYIKNEEQKLEIYKNILISNKDDYFDVQEEIETDTEISLKRTDAFGDC